MSRKILIVEDEIDFLELLKQRAQFHNYICEADISGKTCVQQTVEFKPDVIIMDLSLPEASGTELIKKIREIPEGKTVPIIVCSAYAETDKINNAIESGANTYFIKTGDLNDLFSILESYVDSEVEEKRSVKA